MAQTNTNIKNKIKRFNLGIFNKILFALIIVCGVYYVTGTNDLSVKSFKLQELKSEISYLNNENNNLDSKKMSLSSYNSVNQRIAELDMVAAGDVEYITMGMGVVAVKK